jgi:hypothetical protein
MRLRVRGGASGTECAIALEGGCFDPNKWNASLGKVGAKMALVVLMVVVLILALLLRLEFEAWMRLRKSKEVAGIFARKGAVKPSSACRLEDLGLRLYLWKFGLRDYRSEALRALISGQQVLQTADGRYYLSREAHESYLKDGGAEER